MSMQVCVLSDTRLNSISEWQHAIDVAAFPLRLIYEGDFSKISGFLPVCLDTGKTGFECRHLDPRVIASTYARFDFGRDWKQALALTWIGDYQEMQAAWMAAAAYACATRGMVFDEAGSELLDATQAVQAASEIGHYLPELERMRTDHQ